jgi:hypothetical protein
MAVGYRRFPGVSLRNRGVVMAGSALLIGVAVAFLYFDLLGREPVAGGDQSRLLVHVICPVGSSVGRRQPQAGADDLALEGAAFGRRCGACGTSRWRWPRWRRRRPCGRDLHGSDFFRGPPAPGRRQGRRRPGRGLRP